MIYDARRPQGIVIPKFVGGASRSINLATRWSRSLTDARRRSHGAISRHGKTIIQNARGADKLRLRAYNCKRNSNKRIFFLIFTNGSFITNAATEVDGTATASSLINRRNNYSREGRTDFQLMSARSFAIIGFERRGTMILRQTARELIDENRETLSIPRTW